MSDVSNKTCKACLSKRVDIAIDKPCRLIGWIELSWTSIEQLWFEHIDIAVADLGGLHDIALSTISKENALYLKKHLPIAVVRDEINYAQQC